MAEREEDHNYFCDKFPDRPLTKEDLRVWRRIVNKLKKTLIPIHDVKVNRTDRMGEYWGSSYIVYNHKKYGTHFRIKIHKKLTRASAYYALAHEYAHVLSWVEGKEVQDHGPEWGVWYAACYKIVFETD